MMGRTSIFATFLVCALGAMAQNVSIRAVNKPAAEIFRSIMLQTDKNFVYSTELLKDVNISVNVKDRPLKKVLDEIFKDTDIQYQVKGKNVILKRKKKKEASPKTVSEVKPNRTPRIQVEDSVKITMLQPVDVVSQP